MVRLMPARNDGNDNDYREPTTPLFVPPDVTDDYRFCTIGQLRTLLFDAVHNGYLREDDEILFGANEVGNPIVMRRTAPESDPYAGFDQVAAIELPSGYPPAAEPRAEILWYPGYGPADDTTTEKETD